MTSNLDYLAWLQKTSESLTTSDGKPVEVWRLTCDFSDAKRWSSWAAHFRSHYCLDAAIDKLKKGTPHEGSRRDYLLSIVLPDEKDGFGPAIRAGDFAEIMVCDLLEGQFGYWVPRVRYQDKAIRNESPKGIDVVGVKLATENGTPSPQDALIAIETKAQLSGSTANPRLQDAIDDSAKSPLKKAETLNAIKRRLLEQDRAVDADRIERFQDPLKNPYEYRCGAVAFFCNSVYDPVHVQSSTTVGAHPNAGALSLIIVRADTFMQIVHRLYNTAADEA